jgi:magnesium transporter
MIRSFYCAPNGKPEHDLNPQEIAMALSARKGILWVDLQAPTPEETKSILSDVFHFHPLAIEDTQTTGYQTPKVDDYDDYIFVIAHTLAARALDEIDAHEIDFFLGSNYLVTSEMTPDMPIVQRLWQRLKRDDRLISRGPDFLCHALLDALVDDYMPVLDQLEDEIELLEDQVLEVPRTESLERILSLKHSILTLRRFVTPQREVMNRLSRDDFPQVQPQSRIYFRDIYDHLVRIQDLSESLRDIVTGALDTYLSVTSNRLNEVMKALTIVSTIFLPLSFVAGVYGMNFVNFPEIHWNFGYAYVWILFLAIAVAMLVLFKRRGWW